MAAGQRRFAVLGDNLFKIADRIMRNQRICRMLKYQVESPFVDTLADVDGDELLNKQILILPKIPDDNPEETSFICIVFDKYVINQNNPDFKLSLIRFDVICPYKQWIMNDKSLRPYLIMEELDKMFNEAKLAGIGNLQFIQCEKLTLSPQLGGYSLYYRINEFN